MFRIVVVRDDLGVVGDVDRLAVFVFAGGPWVSQRFLRQGSKASGPIVIGALSDIVFAGAEHVLAFVAARPVDRIPGHALVLIA
ncbi:hypothetical protein D3C71_2025670 [compost metagenome]